MNNENNKSEKSGVRNAGRGGFRPKFALYHANAKGTGSAVKLELHPAHDDVDGSIFLTLACQKTVGDARGPKPSYPTFDWETAMSVKLDFDDLTRMLQVFRGELESVNDDRGFYHRAASFNTVIKFRHVLEPNSGYALELYRNTPGKSDDDRCGFFFFGANEALGLAAAIETSLGVICFGIPSVQPHDVEAYRRNVREVRNVTAA